MDKIKWHFRRNWLGKQILQTKHRKASTSYGYFTSYWKDATQEESIEFTVEIKLMMEKYSIVKKIKEEHPEFFLV